MNNLYMDAKTKAIFSIDKLGSHLVLKGINQVGGIFRITKKDFDNLELEPITDEKKLSKVKYKGGWPLRLAETLLKNKPKSREVIDKPLKARAKIKNKKTLSINFNVKEEVKKPKKKITKVVTKKKSEGPTKSVSSEITLAQICEELKIKPAAARSKLRGQVEKPKEGWKWTDPKEISKIKKLLGGK